MKPFNVILTILFLLFSVCLHAESVKDALNKNKVQVKISENSESPHYHTPLIIELTNKSNTTLNLYIDNGTILEANKDEFQNFIVTERLLVHLKPNETKSVGIHGMCIEQSDMAPNNEVLYAIGGEAPDKMKQLSLFIEKNKQHDPNGQFLMWDLAENYYADIENISFEIDELGNIWVLKKEEDKLVRIETEVDDEPAKPKLIISGDFTMNLSSNKNVHIAMFNTRDVLVKELYNNPKTPGGETKLEYEFNSYDFEEEEYYIKLVVDGRVVLNRTIDMSY